MAQFQEPSTWTPVRVQQHIDPILLADKRLSISLEMQPKSLAAARALTKKPSQWAEAEAKLADEWAEKLFTAWIEIWDTQGIPRCHALYRAFYESEVQTLLAGRRASFQGKCRHYELANRRPHYYSAVLGWFAREMNKLASKWNRRMDVESRKVMYAARKERLTPPTAPGVEIPSLSDAMAFFKRKDESKFTWKELENRFQNLQEKTNRERNLSVDFIRTIWHSGSISEEWFISGGTPARRKEFEYLASASALKLGYPPDRESYTNWLGCVRLWMEAEKLDKDSTMAWRTTGEINLDGNVGTTEGLCTYRIAELSAMYCLALNARGTPEWMVEQFQGHTHSKPLSPFQPKLRAPSQRKLKIMQAIFAALQAGDEGRKYCKTVDKYRPPISPDWLEDDWPGTYWKAYSDSPKWAKRIQNQKTKFRKEYDRMTPQQQESIIQGTGSNSPKSPLASKK